MTTTTPASATRVEPIVLESGRTFLLRPLEREDALLYPAFDARLTDDDRRLRFFSPAHLSPGQIARFTGFDRRRAFATIAVEPDSGAIAGVARLHRLPDGSGEFAALVRSDLKGQGLGRELMERLVESARVFGVAAVVGLILPENVGMLSLARQLGFSLQRHPDDPGLVVARLDLAGEAAAREAA